VQIEMAACTAMDQLRGALSTAAEVLTMARLEWEAMAAETSVVTVHAEWHAALENQRVMLKALDLHANSLIAAVSKMLAA
jgi:hypothetical protein